MLTFHPSASFKLNTTLTPPSPFPTSSLPHFPTSPVVLFCRINLILQCRLTQTSFQNNFDARLEHSTLAQLCTSPPRSLPTCIHRDTDRQTDTHTVKCGHVLQPQTYALFPLHHDIPYMIYMINELGLIIGIFSQVP